MCAPSGQCVALLQCLGGFRNQIVRRQWRCQIFTADLAIGTHIEMQSVSPVNQCEDRLQQVVAIWPPARDVQEKIEFGRGRDVI